MARNTRQNRSQDKWEKKQQRSDLAELSARKEGPAKRTWHLHDLLPEKFQISHKQRTAREHWYGDGVSVLAMLGTAGTAKTYTAIRLACEALVAEGSPIRHIKIIRAPIQAVEQGHLPGTLEEKNEPFEKPYPPMLQAAFGRPNTYRDMKTEGVLSFESVSFLRGTTIDDTIVILDEVQNCTFEQINTVITRLGQNSRIIITGDNLQVDLTDRYLQKSGLARMRGIMTWMGQETAIVEFGVQDIVRGPVVKSWITACENHAQQNRDEAQPCTA